MSATPSGTSMVLQLLSFGHGRALQGLAAEASPDGASMSVTLRGKLLGGSYQSGGLPGLGLCT